MRRFLVQSGRLLLRTPWLILVYAVGFIALNAYMFQYTATAHVYESIILYLNLGQGIGLVLFLLMAVLSFEFLRLERSSDLDECVAIDQGCWRQMRLQRVCLLLFMVVLTSACVFLYQFIALKIYGVLTVQVAWHLFFSCLLNVCLAQVIAVFMGAAMAACWGRPAAYVCVAVFAFLTTSVAKEWAAMLPGNVGSVGYALKWFVDLFSITVLDADYLPDDIYGLPMEPVRWFASLFWIFLFGAIFLWSAKTRNRNASYIPSVSAACAALVFFSLFLCGINDSTVRLDERASSLNGAYEYEIAHESKEEAAEFRILSYQMELSARRRLSATVNMEVSKNLQENHYKFTLYQGYHIVSVTDEAGTELPYERDGHYLNVEYQPENSTGTIVIRYQGSGSRSISNEQGVVLPGCIPWYPVAGYVSMWTYQTASVGLYIPTEEIPFQVVFDTNLPLVSNLEQIDTNTYAGTASSVTFVGGLLEEKEEDGVVYYDSPLNTTSGLELAETKQLLNQAEEILDMSFDYDLTAQKIICLPGVVNRTVGGQPLGVVFMPDYILASTGIAFPSYVLEHLIPRKDGAEALRELLLYYLEYGTDAELLYDEATLTENVMPDRSDIITFEQTDIESFRTMSVYEQALRYQMKQYGASEVLRACYEYLQSDRTEDQVDFVYQLGDELS